MRIATPLKVRSWTQARGRLRWRVQPRRVEGGWKNLTNFLAADARLDHAEGPRRGVAHEPLDPVQAGIRARRT